MQHPSQLGAGEVAAFLTTLATRDHVSASTQNRALSAIVSLYEHAMRHSLGEISAVTRVRTPP